METKTNKIKLFEMFAGYGGASFALKKAGIPFECVGVSEVDKYAMQCYTQNHKGFHYGDCTKINPNELPDFDLLTGGFPCQAFSVAGKGLGELDTRGTLFNEIIRIAEVKQPKYMLLENVKGLTTKRHKTTFEKILSELRRIGYDVKYKILNSKQYGIPQNRERIFFVCKLGQWDFMEFQFTQKEELKIFLKDILENEVDEKYYLKQKQMDQLIKNNNWNCNPSGNGMNGVVNTKNIGNTISTNKGEGQKIIQLNNPKHSNNRVYSTEGVSPTLRDMSQGGNKQPFIGASRGRNPNNPSDRTTGSPTEQRLEPKFDGTTNCISTVQKDNYVCIKNATKKGYLEAKEGDGVNLENPNSKTRRGRVQTQLSPTLQCNNARGVVTDYLTIRKLTPKECFRLMGFLDDEINLNGLSNTQQYKLAGNGWDINLVSKIFREMFK